MLKALRVSILLLLSSPLWATWGLVQVKSNNSCTGATCAITVTSTGAGHVIVVALSSSNSVTISSVSGGGTYTLCGATCQTGNSTTGYTDMAYTLSSTSGATSITITSGATGSAIGAMWEFSYTLTPSFDTSNHNLVTTNCTSCAGTSLTLSGGNDVIATIGSCGSTCSGVTTYTNDLSNPNGELVAHLLNTTSGTAPTITQSPTSNMATAAIAIKEVSAASATMPPQVY